MSYNFSAAGFIAFLEKENNLDPQNPRYSCIEHNNNEREGRHYIMFYDREQPQTYLPLLEEDTPIDNLEKNCCSTYIVQKGAFNKFFLNSNIISNVARMEQLKNDITYVCQKSPQGYGAKHCNFHESLIWSSGRTYSIPGNEKLYERTCNYGVTTWQRVKNFFAAPRQTKGDNNGS